MPIAVCPECGAEIHVDEEADKGDVIHCEECEVTLEVVGLDPMDVVALYDADYGSGG